MVIHGFIASFDLKCIYFVLKHSRGSTKPLINVYVQSYQEANKKDSPDVIVEPDNPAN